MNDQPLTLNECFDRYERDILPKKAPRTQKDYARHLKALREDFGRMHPDDLQPRHIGRYLDVPKGKIHRNRRVAVLSAVYQKMVGRWYVCANNPCSKVERNESRRRDRYVTNEEFTIVYDAMPVRIQIAMDLALLTGQRQGDLLALRWDHVTPQGISFRQSKTGKRLRVALSDDLNKVLERARRLKPDIPKDYVIRTQKGEAYTPEGFRGPWQRRMRRLCTGYWLGHKGRKPVWVEPKLKERFTFHDIRAKTVSDSATLDEAFERAGHTNMSMTRGTYDRAERTVKPLR